MNPTWIIDLELKARTIKVLEENLGVNLCDHGPGNGFLDMTPKAHVTKGKINWNSSNFKTKLLYFKDTINKVKRKPM